MDAEAIARWQFGITTVYHYLFVPITIALSMLVAVLQTIWYRSGNEQYLRLTKFFGKLFLINFALGVVTGIVQEFQFGMNWSEYSRFVGDVFGAPLALEALLAFFLESTFIGLWIFGWDKLPKKLHLTAIYCAAIGTMVSAIFILAANSWMQNPVGAVFNATTGRAELDGFSGFFALLTNPVFLATFLHTIAGAYMVAGGLIAGISGWHLAKLNGRIAEGPADEQIAADAKTHRWSARFGAIVLLVSSIFVLISGDLQAKVMTQVQPMKMAAAEAMFNSADDAPFSIVTIGSLDGKEDLFSIRVPGLLSFISGEKHVQGMRDLEAQFATQGFLRNDGSMTTLQEGIKRAIAEGTVSPRFAESFKIVNITPNVPISYWSFRIMIGLGFLGMAIAAYILFATRKKNTVLPSRLWTALMVTLPFYPLFANSVGWIFTEMGRQPWLVAGVMPTAMGVSPTVTAGEVLFSLIVYTLVYGALAVIEVGLFLKYAKAGLPEVAPVEIRKDDEPMSFAY
ncbi:MAG: cytochrome ubiquinol oxidase subunit I [Propionibacteriaceae bacterium]|nr:cytochrome ubiquinol oxidase subunit I [Propionibacteriaceae bacterium]